MPKKKNNKSPPFFIINIGSKEIPILKYTYRKEKNIR
jgi:hypothetical protein